ncbi:MAG: hypothetical protein KA788_05920 [Lacunisphaera sp.]|nr:hypothetical protein [Lacunisphaera sp.]MBP7648503.1 hypothetical protein [Phenylobacterium sp.]
MTPQNGNPGAGGAGASKGRSSKQQNTNKVTQPKAMLKVHRASDNSTHVFHGRDAQTLDMLIQLGALGVTSGEASVVGWARRTSAYIKNLRDAGVQISTTREPASGAMVGRYHLLDSLTVVASANL